MSTPTVQDVAHWLEAFAPLPYQESYDNSGLLAGQPEWEVKGILVSLDCTEAVVDEAIDKGCNLVVAHHPIVFGGVKKLTGGNYVERTLIKAIKADMALYAIHTNLDNVRGGVSGKIAERLALRQQTLLAPKPDTLAQLTSFVPGEQAESVMDALHEAGAGHIGNYKKCGFSVAGTGQFMPKEDANPHIGDANRLTRVDEARIEVIFPRRLQKKVVEALHRAHPYEEVAHYIVPLRNAHQGVGLGVVGELDKPMDSLSFLTYLKDRMQTGCIRHTSPLGVIRRVAVCGGSGSSLLPHALAHGADVYVSADFKYHDFFDAEGRIMIADIGHYESEQFTKTLLKEILEQKFRTFAVALSNTLTNPISYF